MALYLHIGASKCGSSALQTYLTHNPLIEGTDGATFEYAAIDGHGDVLRGAGLGARPTIAGYRSSVHAEALRRQDLGALASALSVAGRHLLLSSEAWFQQPDAWNAILERMRLDAHVIVYVRPQLHALNSAWWQWGAWWTPPDGTAPFELFLRRRLGVSFWGRTIERWQQVPRVKSVCVRLLTDNIVADAFEHVFQAPPPTADPVVNAGLPATVLRLFQRHRQLRPGPQDCAIDLVLGRHLARGEKPPWVIPRDWVERVLEATHGDNLKLLGFLDPGSRARMIADPHWWDPRAYAARPVECPYGAELAPGQLEALCVQLIAALAVREHGAEAAAPGGRV